MSATRKLFQMIYANLLPTRRGLQFSVNQNESREVKPVFTGPEWFRVDGEEVRRDIVLRESGFSR